MSTALPEDTPETDVQSAQPACVLVLPEIIGCNGGLALQRFDDGVFRVKCGGIGVVPGLPGPERGDHPRQGPVGGLQRGYGAPAQSIQATQCHFDLAGVAVRRLAKCLRGIRPGFAQGAPGQGKMPGLDKNVGGQQVQTRSALTGGLRVR